MSGGLMLASGSAVVIPFFVESASEAALVEYWATFFEKFSVNVDWVDKVFLPCARNAATYPE